ncbi:YihY/virulence factor BrkB family protein [Nocardia farcinica]|uniref:YihY family inner membrane protein n=1 Tax=Nocardia farcinica TaxID=37329 RepID=A0A449G8B2_NOCFR|nr:YihY/virulence factor BrkB family protein [Nocardia farcinica]MBF6068096.1 YihY/virulence factor BrkB family protein [Nocardia farcinica]MBF6295188.1 YihY/virulence factor BrkB family protein [Nocardia farcinica]MBF6361630.1 YihY/virulence factor BrkB family protein [Nocardia farcinica]MBF6375793.1 YihY/virulence factor BrkB family protein [Nocardia farcinica]MBF6381722.1 YihY/virulence factor BrkB family protein [Nocardia farcinica]
MSSETAVRHGPALDWSGGPARLNWRSWWGVLRRTVTEFRADNVTDWAAALTYYSVLSVFPGIIVLTALLGALSPTATDELVTSIREIGPGSGTQLLVDAIGELRGASSLAGPMALFGVATALWTASGYIGAFMRAANAIYEVEEGRPLWKTVPVRVGLTAAMVVLIAVTAVGVVATGGIARRVGDWLGLGPTAVAVWEVAKWPVLAVLVSLAFALLYWVAPNARQPGFRWLSPGSVLAVLVWVLASAGFAFYVANFGSYNKVYGSLGGVAVFLVWVWISNVAVLLGAEFDAELARGRRIEQGLPPDQEPFLPPRDDWDDDPDAAPR